MKRVVAVLIVLALVGAVVLAALSVLGSDDPSDPGARPPAGPAPTSTPDAGATRAPSPGLAEYYGQELDWESCAAAECATLTVPLDYDEPAGETIDLALLKVPAREPSARIGSLVVNPGGPGAAGTSYAAQSDQVFREPLLQQFDIVGFDPRGTGDSAPVDCLSDEELDDFIATDPDPDTRVEERAYVDWVQRIGEGCSSRSGALAEHVSTVEAARDMDVLRAALGESTLTYFGASYGTKLGATYADLFPDKVGRMVLDGAVDLSIDSRELSLEQAAGFETALRAYVQDCVDQGDCVLGDSVSEGLDRIKDLTAEIDASPLPTNLGDRELEVGNAFYGIVAPLYNRDYWFILTQALQGALDGDGSILLRLSDLYTSREASGTYADNSSEAIYAINCLDDAYSIPASQVASSIPAFEEASPTFGRVFAWGLTGCGGFPEDSPEDSTGDPSEIRAEGAAPIVVVGTTRDPATPYLWAVHLAEQLESGVLVSRDGDGHTGYNAGNACVDKAIEAYLVRGKVPQDGLSC